MHFLICFFGENKWKKRLKRKRAELSSTRAAEEDLFAPEV